MTIHEVLHEETEEKSESKDDPLDAFLWAHDLSPTAATVLNSDAGRARMGVRDGTPIRLRNLKYLRADDLEALGIGDQAPDITSLLNKTRAGGQVALAEAMSNAEIAAELALIPAHGGIPQSSED